MAASRQRYAAHLAASLSLGFWMLDYDLEKSG
jgi:hypothetical protein